MTTYRMTPAAQADLGAIWDYTAQTWGAAQAESYVRAIVSTCDALVQGSRSSQSAEHIRPGYRKAASGRHMIYFKPSSPVLTDDRTQGIDVIRILHQRMDVPDKFERPDS